MKLTLTLTDRQADALNAILTDWLDTALLTDTRAHEARQIRTQIEHAWLDEANRADWEATYAAGQGPLW